MARVKDRASAYNMAVVAAWGGGLKQENCHAE